MKKNEEYTVKIIDYGMDGEGVAKIDGMTVFIPGALKEEKCKIHITKILSSHAFARASEVIEESSKRVEKDCATYPRCGGCSLRHITYDETLNIKREKVQNLVNKMLPESKVTVGETVGMSEPLFYRNKAIYPVNNEKEPGIFANRSHNIIPFEECKIQTKLSQEIAKYVASNWAGTVYDEKTNKGLLRNIMVREGFKTGEAMLVIVQNGKDISSINFDDLLSRFPQIKTIVVNVNTKDTNVVLSNENIVLYGNGYIMDELCGYKFKISPNSFYQVNTEQTEKIYELAINEANLNVDDTVCDLYCGIGTIGIIASAKAKKVYGIEISEQAINDAKENSKLNGVKNIDFIQGNVETAFDELLKKDVKPDVVIVDPPRKGLDKTTIENLIKLKLERMVYVSCNPATMVRDLKELQEVYNIKSITPVDNFCYSPHVECVVAMSLK